MTYKFKIFPGGMAPQTPLLLLFQCILRFQNFKVVISFFIHDNLLANSNITTLAWKVVYPHSS